MGIGRIEVSIVRANPSISDVRKEKHTWLDIRAESAEVIV
jgi:hypothetical protein